MADPAESSPRKPSAPEAPPGGWWAPWLLAAFVVLFCLIAGELFLRHWFPLNGVLLRRDSRYLYSYMPGARSRTTHLQPPGYPPGDTVRVAINKQGRRGEALSNDPSTPRILVFGDSFIAAEYTSLENTFVYQLEQLLRSRLSRRVQVANAGVPGYGPDQESLAFEDQIDSVRPALVIFAIYSSNDFGDLMRNRLFALDGNNQLVRRSVPQLDRALNQYFEEAESLPRLQIVRRLKLLSSIVRSSEAVRQLKIQLHLRANTPRPVPAPAVPPLSSTERIRGWLAIREKEYRAAVENQDSEVHNLFSDTYDADISLYPASASSRYKRVFMARMMERIQNIASRHSVPVVFLIIPAAIDTAEWDVSVDTTAFSEYRRTGLTDVLEGIAKDLHSPYLNLFQLFREHWREDLYFHGGNDHWNTLGQKLAAETMADYILLNRLLGAPPLR